MAGPQTTALQPDLSAIPVFVINLDGSQNRMDMISARLAAQKVAFHRVPAVDGRKLDLSGLADDDACRREMGRSIQPGEVGCYLSHLKAMRAFVESGAEYGVVLEDDAIPTADFAPTLAALVPFLQANRHLQVDAINLGASDFKYATRIAKVGEVAVLRAHRFPMLATAVLWSRAGAESLLRDHDIVRYPWDNFLRMRLTRGRVGLSLRPAIVTTADIASDITARSVTGGRSRQNRSRIYFLRKQRRIIREKVIALGSLVAWRLNPPHVDDSDPASRA
jgi:glycosyl transferase family 25